MESAPEILKDRDGNAFELKAISCPVCGPYGEDFLGYRGGRHQRWGLGVETRIMRCQRCGLIFPNPFPYPMDADRLYGDPDKYFAAHDLEQKIDTYRALVKKMRERSSVSDPRLLDVGSGRGDFLRAAQLEGLTKTTGLEFSTAMIEYAKADFGIELLSSTLEELIHEKNGPFDVVVLNAVLEHVYNPDEMIAQVRELTEPGAILYLDIPQEPNLLTALGNAANRLRGQKVALNLMPTWPPYHVFGFNRRSLSFLLNKYDFEIFDVRVYATPDIRASSGAKDRLKAIVGTQINRLANATNTASNMYVWARRR